MGEWLLVPERLKVRTIAGGGDGVDRGAHALAHEHDVRRDPPLLDGPHPSGAAQARLHLVEDHHSARLVAQLPDAGEVVA